MRPERDLLRIGATLRLDAVAAEVSAELGRSSIRALVIRGPAIKHTLYADGSYRAYDDVDFLVSLGDLERARGVLGRLGFSPAISSDRSQPWVRDDGVTIDLHTTIVGIGASPGEVWSEFSRETTSLTLGEARVEIPGRPILALIVVLHAAQHGERAGKALADLERALEQLPLETWRETASAAALLQALPAFAAGLELVPGGAELTAELGLEEQRSEELALRVASPPPIALGLLRLSEAAGVRNKARILAAEVVPRPAFMRAMYPIARRGPLGLAAAYAWRPFWLLGHLAPAIRAVRRARRAVR